MIDVSSIPVAAVDRIEIVADGASAIYGADAVAGVVNIRLKRDYHGLEAKARVGASTDGGNVQQQYGLLGGRSWTSGGVLAAYDYSHSSAIDAGERSYAGSMNPGSTLFPKTSRHSLLVSGHQAIGPDITLAADLLYKKGRVHQTLGYDQMLAPDVFGLDNVSTSESVGIAPSLSTDLGRNWQFKASGFFGTDQTGGYAELFSGGDLLSHIDKHFFNRNLAIEGGFQGPLFRLAAGEVAVAFGAGARRNDFRAILPVNVVDRRRDNIFAYAEVFAPLTSPEQDIAGFHRLSVSGALRFEDYSDVRSIVTPKLGMTWEPVSSLRLAVSWGRSFKMPTLYQQYGGYSTVLARASSYGAGYPPMANVIVATGPDSRIGPERSENWTLSAQLTPVDGFKLTAAWYRIDYRDRVAPPISSFVGILDNPLYAGLVAQNPAAAELATLIEGSLFGLENRTGETYDPANVIALIDGRERNIARQRYSGIDLSARYRVALGPSERLTLSAAGSFLESRQQLISGLPWTDLAGTIFHPAKFRARGGLSYEAHHFTLSGFLNHMSALEDDRRDPTARIPPYPAQLFAEHGYVVLLVNTPRSHQTTAIDAAYEAWVNETRDIPPRTIQDLIWLNEVASFEAAVEDLIETGAVDPARVGIAGYSRGSQSVNVTMTQSKMFRAASSGDGGYLEPAFYPDLPGSYDTVFGGPPTDAGALPNYQRLAPSLRADQVCGAMLLQMATPYTGAVDLYAALRRAHVPAQITLYPGATAASDETHIFHIPSNRIMAMQENVAWFDYWLLGKRNPKSPVASRYLNWDKMREAAPQRCGNSAWRLKD